MPVTGHSRHEDVELRVWGADDDHLWGHVTKYHLREELHISRSEVLNAAHTDNKKTQLQEAAQSDEHKSKERKNICNNEQNAKE